MTLQRELKHRKKMLYLLASAEWPTLAAAILGCILYVVGVVGFTIPYRFPDAGVTGLAVLASYTWGVSPALIVALANVVLLAWGWKQLSPRLVMWTVFNVALITIAMKLLDGATFFPKIEDRLLVAMIGGAIKGFGGGMVLRSGASMGGLDIITLALRKRYGVEVGRYSFYINLVILTFASFVVGIENALFGLVGVYASSVVTDNVLTSFDRRRLVFIITRNPEPAVEFIIKELNRGVTMLDSRGGYTREDQPTLMCLLSRRQVVDLKRFLRENDPRSFMVVSDATEVLGRGFKDWKSV